MSAGATRPITPEVQAELYKESDARFAAQTGITRKLDPHNAIDQTWIPTWLHIYAQVKGQYEHGTLAWTYNHPGVAAPLAHAAAAGAQAAAQFADAQAAPTPAAQSAAMAVYTTAMQAAQQASAQAAAAQHAMTPPTVSPPLVQAAAHQVAQHVTSGAPGAPPPAATPSDAVTAVQSVAAPAHAAQVTAPPGAPSPGSPGSGVHVPHGPDGKRALIGIGIAGLFLGGIALANLHTDRRIRHRRHRRSFGRSR